MYRTRFPRWNFEHDFQNLSVGHVCNVLMKNELQIQIYHIKISTDGQYTSQESILIGTVYIDGSNLAKHHDQLSVSGLYHIFKNVNDKYLDDFKITNEVTQGQLEISISVEKPLLS